jgi:hypothetical protein
MLLIVCACLGEILCDGSDRVCGQQRTGWLTAYLLHILGDLKVDFRFVCLYSSMRATIEAPCRGCWEKRVRPEVFDRPTHLGS